MAVEYFCCYHSYRRKIAKLSDQEVGRLFRSLLEYSETGETQELAGREAVAFDFIADDIDRAKENYDSKCKQMQANASKRYQKQTDVCGGRENKDKDKDKVKEESEKEEKPPAASPAPTPEFGPVLQEAFEDWLKYKRERREAYKPTGLKSLTTQIKNQAAIHGEDVVAALIRQCMASNWKGIIFDRLQGKIPSYGRSSTGFETSNPFAEMLAEERGRR